MSPDSGCFVHKHGIRGNSVLPRCPHFGLEGFMYVRVSVHMPQHIHT